MNDQKLDGAKPISLSDEEIITERKLPRRAFLSTTGVLLAGGAAAVVAGAKAVAKDFTPQGDPDKPKPADPDKPSDQKRGDPDKPRPADPDKPPPPPPADPNPPR